MNKIPVGKAMECFLEYFGSVNDDIKEKIPEANSFTEAETAFFAGFSMGYIERVKEEAAHD